MSAKTDIMNINLTIDRLIVEDINLSTAQRNLLIEEVKSELSRLLTDNGLPLHLLNGRTYPKLNTKIDVTQTAKPTQMGQQIARSIYQELNQSS